MNELIFTADTIEDDLRVDVFLTGQLESFSRSYIQKIIKEGGVRINDKEIRPNYRVKEGDILSVRVPEDRELEILPENIPLDIVYEDEDILIVNKPQGMVVHPAAGHSEHTLVNALLYHCRGRLSGINGVLRPGIVHRIDKDTSGLLAVCKSDRAHLGLSELLSTHDITRKYRAILHGICKEDTFTVTGNIGRNPKDRKKMAVVPEGQGRRAVTHFKVLERLAKGYTYAECTLETGRTHQIRVHASHIGHPVLGDPLYGPKKCPVSGLNGQTLLAMTLGFVHPVTHEYMEFSAGIPEYFQNLLGKLS